MYGYRRALDSGASAASHLTRADTDSQCTRELPVRVLSTCAMRIGSPAHPTGAPPPRAPEDARCPPSRCGPECRHISPRKSTTRHAGAARSTHAQNSRRWPWSHETARLARAQIALAQLHYEISLHLLVGGDLGLHLCGATSTRGACSVLGRVNWPHGGRRAVVARLEDWSSSRARRARSCPAGSAVCLRRGAVLAWHPGPKATAEPECTRV